MSQPFPDRATDALIAAALRRGFSVDPPSEKEISESALVADQTPDTPADAAMLLRIQQRIQEGIRSPQSNCGSVPCPSPASQLMAMNRKNEEDTFCDKTQSGLNEARRKALEELLAEERNSEQEKPEK